MNGAEEVLCGFIVSGCYGAELLELGEEVFDEVASFVEVSVMVSGELAIGLGRDDCGLAGFGQGHKHPLVGVERFVSNQGVRLHAREQVIGATQIMGLSAGQEEPHWVAQGIDQTVDLGTQSPSGTSDCLVLPGFFWAPALC